VKHLTIEADVIDGTPAAFLHCEPLVRELPAPLPLPIPEKADAGHIAAMALYLTLGEDAEVVVTDEAMTLLESDLADPAKKRGVYAAWADDEPNLITVVSDDGSRMVELLLPVESPVS
jgi:hypothetical protein